MAHSAEDITSYILARDYNYTPTELHSEVKHGFVIVFTEKPDFDIRELEQKILDIIHRDVKIQALDGEYIEIDGEKIYCTGKRIHVQSSARIEKFRLVKEFKYDPISKRYLLVGIVGKEQIYGFNSLPPMNIDKILHDDGCAGMLDG